MSPILSYSPYLRHISFLAEDMPNSGHRSIPIPQQGGGVHHGARGEYLDAASAAAGGAGESQRRPYPSGGDLSGQKGASAEPQQNWLQVNVGEGWRSLSGGREGGGTCAWLGNRQII